MTTPKTYNQEEVQELFDVVFKLSAKDINDKLTKVRNRPDIAKRRWFWELLQNAKDSVSKSETVDVFLLISKYENGKCFVEFSHNGNPFKYQDAKNLIFPYSDKDEDSGEGPIIWNLDWRGVSFSEPQLINRCPGGEYHEQTIEYRQPNQAVMQYTGLKDKEGNEIYEGDIIEYKCNYGSYKSLVKYKDATFYAGYNRLEQAEFIKIIGNKYENPDLYTKLI